MAPNQLPQLPGDVPAESADDVVVVLEAALHYYRYVLGLYVGHRTRWDWYFCHTARKLITDRQVRSAMRTMHFESELGTTLAYQSSCSRSRRCAQCHCRIRGGYFHGSLDYCAICGLDAILREDCRRRGEYELCGVVRELETAEVEAYDGFLQYQAKKMRMITQIINTTPLSRAITAFKQTPATSLCFIDRVASEIYEQTVQYKQIEMNMLSDQVGAPKLIRRINDMIKIADREWNELSLHKLEHLYALGPRPGRVPSSLRKKLTAIDARMVELHQAMRLAGRFRQVLQRRLRLIRNYNDEVQTLMNTVRTKQRSALSTLCSGFCRQSAAATHCGADVIAVIVRCLDTKHAHLQQCGCWNPNRR